MPSRKPTRSASRATRAKTATVTPLVAPARRAAPDMGGLRARFLETLSSDGSAPEVAAIVFVHGIGNKPKPSVLKCQWDRALFGAPMGERTRMSYWVDRDRYPRPDDESCDENDSFLGEAGVGIRALAADLDDDEGPRLTREQRKAMDSLERRLGEALSGDAGPGARVLPGRGVRRWVTRQLTRLFLKDVRDFLYVPEARERMESSVRDRLGETPKGPYIVIGHSQGSMVAFEVLRKLSKAECDVKLFVTIGSPLGLKEVQDELEKWGPLAVPSCVDEWLNVANRLDPVALDAELEGDFDANAKGVKVRDLCVQDFDEAGIGGDWGLNPHSATAYLRLDPVRGRVREVCGPAFGNVMGRSILARDLVDALEDAGSGARHATLIQLKAQEGASDAATLAAMRGLLEERIAAFRKASGMPAKAYRVQHMRHFLSADLTRREIEELRGLSPDLKIERVWRNAVKRALLHQSAQTVQAKPAQLGYGARGKGIGWAVLDTGISAAHPHFGPYASVVAQWDCTRGSEPVRIDPGRKGFGDLDGNGHGTHVAATIAGGMRLRRAPDSEETLELNGMAPEAKLYGFKVLKDNGSGEDAFIIKALDTIADLNERAGQLVIHGVNLSLGGGFDPSVFGCGHTPLCQELRRLWRQGVIVVLAAGNEGYAVLESEDGAVPANMDLSIGDPANLEEAIAVGSIHKTNPHTYGVSYFSSRGPTADGRMKPDLVAPGEKILSARHRWKATDTARDLYVEMSGTSMAAPHVSGLLAAFLSARREFSGYPDRVKAILLAHCTDLARDPYIQGRGMPNLVKMLMNT